MVGSASDKTSVRWALLWDAHLFGCARYGVRRIRVYIGAVWVDVRTWAVRVACVERVALVSVQPVDVCRIEPTTQDDTMWVIMHNGGNTCRVFRLVLLGLSFFK